TALRQVEQTQRVDALVLVPVGGRDGEHPPLAVGRDVRRTDAVHRMHVGRGHRAGICRGCRKRGGGGEEELGLDHATGVANTPRTAKNYSWRPVIREISRFTCSSTIFGKCSSSHCFSIGLSMPRMISSSGLPA